MTTLQAQSEAKVRAGDILEPWPLVKVGSVCDQVQYGWTTSARRGDGLKLLRTTDISHGVIDWASVPACQETPPDVSKYTLAPGDLVVSRAGSVGLSYLVRDCPEAVFASYLIRLRAGPRLLPEFLAAFFKSPAYWSAVIEESAGIAIPNINGSKLKELEMPLPPLPEQKRIVEAIERLTARVDPARARLAAVPAILKRFRQAVLAAACSGRLTEDWSESRSSDANSTGLLRQVDVVRRQAGRVPRVEGAPHELDAPSAWTRVFFGNLLTLLTSGSRGWAEYYSKTGPLFIRSQDINTDRLLLDDVAHVSPPATSADRTRTRAQRHDVLLTITGANVTKCARIDTELPEAYVSQHVALCRPALPEMGQFLHLWLTSPQHGRGVLLDVAYGAGKPGLNLDNIKEVPLALPSLAEQAEIVRRVESLMKLADTIERRVTAAQVRADKLAQSILAKAFRGELVSSDSDSREDPNQCAAGKGTQLCRLPVNAHKSESSGLAPRRKVTSRGGGEGRSRGPRVR